MTEEMQAWFRVTPESDPGKQVVRALQREVESLWSALERMQLDLNDLRRMSSLRLEPSAAEQSIRRTAHRDFS